MTQHTYTCPLPLATKPTAIIHSGSVACPAYNATPPWITITITARICTVPPTALD